MQENKNNPLTVVTQDIPQADVDTDGSGDVAIQIRGLRVVKAAIPSMQGGYVAVQQSISGNVVTFRIFQGLYGGGAAGPLDPVLSTNNIAAITVVAVGRVK